MRCLKCQYPLWDLKPGSCPECGEPFDPTMQRFKPGAVRFCCPHCDQAYFGDGEDGHLNPPRFACVGCGESIGECDCIVRPREDGSHEDRTVPDLSPWHDSTRTRWKRFWGTVGMSMIRPGSLGRGLPAEATFGGAFVFFLLANTLSLVIGFGPILLTFIILPPVLGNAGPPPTAVWFAGLIGLVSWIPVMLILLCLVGGIIHLVLRMTGSTAGGYSRTLVSLGFGSGPLMIGAVPFLGYCLQTPAQIWSLVSTIILLSQAQAVSGLRASCAVLTPVFLVIAAYIGLVLSVVLGAAGRPVGVPGINAALAGEDPLVVMIAEDDPQTVVLSSRDFLEALVEAKNLPGPGEIGGLDGVMSTIPKDADITLEKTWRGRGFQAWSIPGLFVVKVGDAAGYVRPSMDGGYRMKYFSDGPTGSSLSTSTGSEATIHRKVVEAIDEMGGIGDDLDDDEFESWLSSNREAYLHPPESAATARPDDTPTGGVDAVSNP